MAYINNQQILFTANVTEQEMVGATADSEIKAISDNIINGGNLCVYPFKWEAGSWGWGENGYHVKDDSSVALNKRVRSGVPVKMAHAMRVKAASGYQFSLQKLSFDGTNYILENETGWTTEAQSTASTDYYWCVVIKATSGSNVLPEYAETYITFETGSLIDETHKAATDNLADNADSSYLDNRIKGMFVNGGYVYGNYQSNTIRVCAYGTIRLPVRVYVRIKDGYKVTVHQYNQPLASYENAIADSGWVTNSVVLLPTNNYCTVTIAKEDNSDITIDEAKGAVKFYNWADVCKVLTTAQADSEVMDAFLKDWFDQYGVNGDGYLVNVTSRVNIPVALKFPNKILLDVPTGYKAAVTTFADSEITNKNLLTDSGWLEDSTVIVDSKDFVCISLGKVDNSTLTIEEAKKMFKFRVPLDEKIKDYYYTGERINLKKHSFKVKEIVSAPYTEHNGVLHEGVQGFDIHNGIIAQFESDDFLRLIDIKTGDTLARYYCQGGHGGSLAFSNNYFESGDEFPLLYISGCNTPLIFVQRINRANTSLIARIKYTEAQAGYWANACFDFDNKKMYMVGYTENSYADNTSGNNLLKLTTWDMEQITHNDDGTISYALVDTVTMPYANCVQSLAFYDGKIFEVVSTSTAADSEIRVIDPTSGDVLSRFANFPYAISKGEVEGLTFADTGDAFQMVISVKRSGKFTYYGFTF